MQAYIFTDLDDTLFQTLRKCRHDDQAQLVMRATLPDGQPNSYATAKQQWLWQWLQQGFKIIPVTGRDYDGLQRVFLPFKEDLVLNHGAVVLDNQRHIDEIWMARMTTALPTYQEKLMAVWQEVQDYCQRRDGFKCRLVEDFGITWYGVVKHKAGTEIALQPVLSMISNHPFVMDNSLYWHLNGNNFAILPKIINKQDAVAYLIDKYKQDNANIITFAAGDSYSDAPFIALCDYALLPNQTQLSSLLK